MLGDGMVSFGTFVVTVSRRNVNASPKIVRGNEIRSCTLSAADSKSSSPSSLRKCTCSFSSVGSTPPRE